MPFRGMMDVLRRVRPDDSEARALIHSGALDAFCSNGNRTALLWELARWQKTDAIFSKERSLFDGADECLTFPEIPKHDEQDRLRREFSVLGFLCDRHPMTLYRELLERLQPVKATGLNRFIGKRIGFAGWLITGKRVQTKGGDTMEFLTFEDETGIVETTFFPQVYRRFCHMVARNRPYLLEGKVESDWGAVTLTVDKVRPL